MIYTPIKRINISKIVLFLAISLFFSGGVSASFEKTGYPYLAAKIKKIVPKIWVLAATEENVIPDRHYWGMKYEGPKGFSLKFRGITDVHWSWKDKADKWHHEAVSKEAIELWVMPPEYSESWKRFFVMHRPITAELIYSGKNGKVYAALTVGSVISKEEFKVIRKKVFSQAKTMGWYDSPHMTGILSWKTWKEDLQKGLNSK